MKLRNLFAFLGSLALAAALPAQTKVSGTIHCAKPDPNYAVPVGDEAGHLLTLSKQACTWTKPVEIAGLAAKDGADVDTEEVKGEHAFGGGFHWTAMANGDKFFVRYHGESKLDKNGNPVSGHGRWSFAGGTGKLSGLRGGGTWTGAANPDGTMTSEIEGSYQLPAKK
jgi:hypothetical protein